MKIGSEAQLKYLFRRITSFETTKTISSQISILTKMTIPRKFLPIIIKTKKNIICYFLN